MTLNEGLSKVFHPKKTRTIAKDIMFAILLLASMCIAPKICPPAYDQVLTRITRRVRLWTVGMRVIPG